MGSIFDSDWGYSKCCYVCLWSNKLNDKMEEGKVDMLLNLKGYWIFCILI